MTAARSQRNAAGELVGGVCVALAVACLVWFIMHPVIGLLLAALWLMAIGVALNATLRLVLYGLLIGWWLGH